LEGLHLAAIIVLHRDGGGIDFVDGAEHVNGVIALRHRRNGEEREETSNEKGFAHGWFSLGFRGRAWLRTGGSFSTNHEATYKGRKLFLTLTCGAPSFHCMLGAWRFNHGGTHATRPVFRGYGS